MSGKIPLLETFLSIQGEGKLIGKKTVFIRTAGCDYSCSWCDSAFTWDGSEKGNIEMLTPRQVFNRIKKVGGENLDHVTISGGNPALIGEPMQELIELLISIGVKTSLETQGSRWRDWFYLVDDVTLSPKPPSSGMIFRGETLNGIVGGLMENPYADKDFEFKVVIFNDEDLEFAKMINREYCKKLGKPIYLSVGNEDSKSSGDISARLLAELKDLWEKVLNEPELNNAITLPQLHALVYSNTRGV